MINFAGTLYTLTLIWMVQDQSEHQGHANNLRTST